MVRLPVRPWQAAATAIPDALAPLLPRRFDQIGHAIILRMPHELEVYGPQIATAYQDAVPAARCVYHDLGAAGPFRIRQLRLLSGPDNSVVTVKEHGLLLRFDLRDSYYSPRLATERQRIAELVAPAERVWDATSGIGPFALNLARTGARVLASDMNPAAARWCWHNATTNRVSSKVDVVVADATALGPAMGPTFDRVITNLPHEGHRLLAAASAAAVPGAKIHAGLVARRGQTESTLQPWLDALPSLELEQFHVARQIGSALQHVVADLQKVS